jgi:hypothetical protein
MNPKSTNESVLVGILEKLGSQPGSAPPPTVALSPPHDDEPVGEKTWSIARVVGMLRRKAIIIGISSLALAGLMGLRTAKNIPQFQGIIG